MKKFKYILSLFILLFCVFDIYERRTEYISKNEMLLDLNENLDILNNRDDIEVVEDIIIKDEDIAKVVVSENDYLKAIYYFANYSKLKLVDKSSPIIKESDEFYHRIYTVFKFTGSLESFFEFMQFLYYSEIFFDTQEMYIRLNGEFFEISIGYYRERL